MDMLGKHQAVNAIGALIAARALQLSDMDIQFGLNTIEKTGMRNELMRANKALILNDSYKSNPQSSVAALETLASFEVPYKLAVLADMLDLGENSDMLHYQLGKQTAEYELAEVLTYGDMGAYIAQGALNQGIKHVQHFADKAKLIAYLLPYRNKECMILIKGSRSMKMDEVVDALIQE